MEEIIGLQLFKEMKILIELMRCTRTDEMFKLKLLQTDLSIQVGYQPVSDDRVSV